MTGEEALGRLLEGNRRFVQGEMRRPHQSLQRLQETAVGQKPFALVLTCSDSRVVPEILFDCGLGDIFVVRTAGHVLDNVVLGSVELAVQKLDFALILVLGHQNCAAIRTAFSEKITDGYLPHILEPIQLSRNLVSSPSEEYTEEMIFKHIRRTVNSLGNISSRIWGKVVGGLLIKGAYLSLDTGRVRLLEG